MRKVDDKHVTTGATSATVVAPNFQIPQPRFCPPSQRWQPTFFCGYIPDKQYTYKPGFTFNLLYIEVTFKSSRHCSMTNNSGQGGRFIEKGQ